MPTGYTNGVREGKMTSFRDFALQCARAFGACVMMRDDPMSIPAPQDVGARSTHHDEALANAREDLAALRLLTPAQIATKAAEVHLANLSRWRQRKLERDRERENYEAMLMQVRAWTPPTSEHVGMKEFMEKQLLESIDFDCSSRHDQQPAAPSPEEWHREVVKAAEWSVAYHEKRIGGGNRAAQWAKQVATRLARIAPRRLT
jgi:hypothetical protein